MGKLDYIDVATAGELYRIAIDTQDPDLRYKIFRLLAGNGKADMQELLLDLAVNPGRMRVRRAAAHALMVCFDRVVLEVVGRISPSVIATEIESVASRLLILVALRGDFHQNLSIAESLATNHNRRVLLLLVIWFMRDRDQVTAHRIATMLPAGHAAVLRTLAGANAEITSEMLDDLGDQLNADEVLLFMVPKKK